MAEHETDVEKRIEALTAIHGPDAPTVSRQLADALKDLVLPVTMAVHPEIVTQAVVAHAIGMIAAGKITGVVRPELADLLAEVLLDSVKRRAIPDTFGLRN